ncbi:baseplate J/gp47 family protein [Bacillus swezeyi]|uniref:Phage portal protein n=1 Tax=Bacillus swezeyi TaxID=1925020 RepID=A0A5M8S0N2_9BACI|nr:baseplate J/gp47 family protein [Bacillus swezeyi]KAA6453200.1 phage portal protein [Bacillus swezeyi]KAA6476182.1 phage portal protein [Bacillus swezeyi]TYS38570.1 baseplate J/gp47 family protein [Bacillus swezeyi]
MFENQTFEEIMERMLDRVSADIDKRENSVIWNALAPAAAELAVSYIWLDQVLNLVYADTAEGEYLDRRAAEAGLERYQASKAIWSGEFTEGVFIPAGTRFFLEDLYFTMQENGKLACETAGTSGNANLTGQTLLPLDTIPGLEKAVMGNLEIPGRDEESDESLYERYLVRVRREAVSANQLHYKQWAEEVDGVGKAKIFPLWNGEGTVKIVITNAKMEPASQILIERVKQYIDPEPGKGEGMAPIGAYTTVESAVWKDIQISAKIIPATGRTIDDAKQEIEEKITLLYKEIAFKESVIRLSQINNMIYESSSVSDYSEVTINGEAKNLQLTETEIPKLGQVTIIEQD